MVVDSGAGRRKTPPKREVQPSLARPAARRSRDRLGRISSRRRSLLVAPLVLPLLGPLALLLLAGGCGASHSRVPPSAGAGTRPRPLRAVSGGPPEAARAESEELEKLISVGEPIYCAGPHGNEIALTFDDGPGPYTRLALAKLAKHSLHATFFTVGRNIALLPDLTRRERALGAVGDHTFTHPLLTTLPAANAEREIVSTKQLLERSSGGRVFLFRPPYGAHDARIDSIVRANRLLEILWTVDSADSLGANYAQIEHNVIAGLRPGAIILMHENHGQTIRALLSIFSAIQRKHLRAVSVPQLLADDPPSLAQLRAGGPGCGGRIASLNGG